MPHSICTSKGNEGWSYFQRLWRTLLVPDIEPRLRLEQLFETETDEFDLHYAFLSRIDLENETECFDIVYGSHESLRSDTTVPLSDTYCRETITDPEGTLAVSDASAEGWEGDPAYETFGFESYLGTTISVDDELYGTLCFADTAARDDPINDKEKALVEMHGQWVEYTMTHWGESSFREARIDAIEGRAVSSDAIDSMMDALESRTRRVVLATLLDTSETSLATLERRASGTSSDLPDQRPPLARRRAEPVQLPAVDDDHVTPDREQFVDGDALGERRPPAVFAVGADGEDRSRSDRVEPVGVDGGPPVSRHVGPLPRDLSVAGVERPDRSAPTEVDPSRRAVPVGPASPVGHFDDRRTIARRRYRQREPSVEIRVDPLTVPRGAPDDERLVDRDEPVDIH